MSDYKLIVIGAGPGGYEAALQAAKLGMKTAVIENRDVGGTCLNRGCIPTKTLLHSSELVNGLKNGEKSGITAENVTINLERIFEHKREISQKLRSGIESMFESSKVDLFRGTGTLCGEGRVKVTNADGEKMLTADNILIATGSVPARPPIPGLDLPGVITSDEILDGADHLYQSMVIIGRGVIGVELATFYNDLGCEVTIVEGLDRLLPNMDKDLGQNLSMSLKKRGIKIFTSSLVSNVTKCEEGLSVNFTAKDVQNSARGEVVLCAIGRRPNTAGLFAEGVSIEMNRASIAVNEKYETSMKNVYAIGDVSSKIQLAHVATAQGLACVEALAGRTAVTDVSIVPGCIYCRPEIASVGMTEAEAKAAGREVKVGKHVMFSNAKTIISDSDRSFMKVLADVDTGAIVGAQFMCEHATDMISEISVAIANGLSAKQMLKAMRPHPTFEEALTRALEELCCD